MPLTIRLISSMSSRRMPARQSPTGSGSDGTPPGPRSAPVVLRALGVLAGILDVAVRDRRISKNPTRGARNLPKKVSAKERRYLSEAEVVRLAAATHDHTFATLTLVLAYCGLRWSEAIGRRVSDINILGRRVHVNRAAVEAHGVIEIGAPKSWEKRTVPFPGFVVDALEGQCGGKSKGDLVFGDASGNFLRRAKTSEGAGPCLHARLRKPACSGSRRKTSGTRRRRSPSARARW